MADVDPGLFDIDDPPNPPIPRSNLRPVTWTEIKPGRYWCDDCVQADHESGGTVLRRYARHKRKSRETSMFLCTFHADWWRN